MAKIVLFGAPGAGKGTLAGKITKFSDIVHVSTGDLFRANLKNKTPIGMKAKEYMDNGELVPDSVVIGMVKKRFKEDDVKENGVLLDGFPRTVEQAKALDEVADLDAVAYIKIDKDVLEKRITGRRSCTECGAIYNIYNEELTPEEEGKCDKCDGDLMQRDDDTKETFEKRYQTYVDQSEPVIEYYREKNPDLIVELDGSRTMAYTEEELKELLPL